MSQDSKKFAYSLLAISLAIATGVFLVAQQFGQTTQDRNLGGYISGLREDDQATIELYRVELSPYSRENISETVSGNGLWSIHYLEPGQYVIRLNAEGYVSYPVGYDGIVVPFDDAPWSRGVFNFTLYIPQEAPDYAPSIDFIPDLNLGGFISGLSDNDTITIELVSAQRTYEVRSRNGWWRISDVVAGNYTVEVIAPSYIHQPESYDVQVPFVYSKPGGSWSYMNLSFSLRKMT